MGAMARTGAAAQLPPAAARSAIQPTWRRVQTPNAAAAAAATGWAGKDDDEPLSSRDTDTAETIRIGDPSSNSQDDGSGSSDDALCEQGQHLSATIGI